MSVAAVTIIRCVQSHADGAPNIVAATSADFGYHRIFDRNTQLASLPFTRSPVVVSEFAPPSVAHPLLLSAPEMYEAPSFPEHDFRPRGPSLFEINASLRGPTAAASMRSNPTVWQQLRDYRGHGRVRVLTLWESTGGTISLQAGKGGSPSLQWTSSWLNRGDAKRGLLDSLFAVSLAGAANTIRNVTHTGLQQGQSAHENARLAAAAAGPTSR